VEANPIEWLMRWYGEQCNGDWEHSYGIRIETLDNPGWSLTIDLVDTDWEDLERPRVLVERTDADWYDHSVEEGTFKGAGGVANLLDIVREFQKLVGGTQ